MLIFKKMKKIGLIAAVTLLCAACGGKTEANEKNFRSAIEEYLKKEGELCLRFSKWPVDFERMDLLIGKGLPGGAVNQMAALESIGLAKSEDVEVPAVDFLSGKPNGKKATLKRYVLTAAAKPFERTREVARTGPNDKQETQTDLCWGRKALDKVVKWEGPMKMGEYQAATVIYHYKIEDMADWAKKPEFQVAFPHVWRIIESAGKDEQRKSVELTSLGWEAK